MGEFGGETSHVGSPASLIRLMYGQDRNTSLDTATAVGDENNRIAECCLKTDLVLIRRDATHKAMTAIAKRSARIGIEDLNVRGMARNRSLARSVLDGSFGEFRRQLVQEARMTGAPLTGGGSLVPVERDVFSPRFGESRTGAGAARVPL